MARSADGVSVSVSVAELFPVTGSVMPAATDAAPVLMSAPVAEGLIAATTVNVTDVPSGRLTVVLIEPAPVAAVHAAPAVGVHVHDVNAAPEGWVSVTIVAGASDGPLLVTVTVYVVD